MRGARGESGSPKLVAKAPNREWTEPSDLNRSIADLAEPAENAAELSGIMQQAADRVELKRDHVWATRSTCVPARMAASVTSLHSRTD